MQIIGMLIFLLVWLVILWLGSIALEATGMERQKARFQSLSALTGTGFTTREAESIVNHPKRRRIATWLIFFGSVGIGSFFLLLILYLRAGLAAPTTLHIVIIIASILIFILLIWTGVINKLTNIFIKLFHKSSADVPEEMLYEQGNYGLARFKIGETDGAIGSTAGITKLRERGLTVLAIERGKKVLPLPKDEEAVLTGDYLLCYGKVSELFGS